MGAATRETRLDSAILIWFYVIDGVTTNWLEDKAIDSSSFKKYSKKYTNIDVVVLSCRFLSFWEKLV